MRWLDDFGYWLADWWPGIAIIAGTVAACGFIFWAVADEAKQPAFALKKADWTCTASHDETTFVPTIIGKTTMVLPHVNTVCDRYDRRAA